MENIKNLPPDLQRHSQTQKAENVALKVKKRFEKNHRLERQSIIKAKGTGTGPVVNSGPSTRYLGRLSRAPSL